MAARLAVVFGCLLGVARADALPGRDDLRWLERLTFGIDTATVERFRTLGRERFLEEQLAGRDDALPPAVQAQVQALEIVREPRERLLAELAAELDRVKALPDGPDKQAARKALNRHAARLADEAARLEILRALYSPAQLREVMTWFWLNHFSVHQEKERVRWFVGDYVERAIRPHALGKFRDLVMATLTHPAMLQYLDNARNAKDKRNENYARELMELHTLGVDAGYTQQDVQELARVLTGVGVHLDGEPRLPKRRDRQALYRLDGAFEFAPGRHDFGDKTLLGHTLHGSGLAEVEHAVDVLIAQPACGRFISRKLATYFVGDEPSAELVAEMAETFRNTDGDIAAVLRTLFESPQLAKSLGRKFKDPVQFVFSALRLAYDGRPIASTRPILGWLADLGEAPFQRVTPDGYPLVESAWAGSGQLAKRFEVARAIGSGPAGLFDPEEAGTPELTGFPRLASRLFFDAVEPLLSDATRAALDRARSQAEWNTFLLASPDFNRR
jgi:uncharacterized protein (DUF1800 family)